jgi:hypothetical protein
MFRQLSRKEADYLESLSREKKVDYLKMLLFWLAIVFGILSGWAINFLILIYPFEVIPIVLWTALFYVPGLVAVLSLGLMKGPKHIGQELGLTLGGITGLAVGLTFLFVNSIIKIRNGRASLSDFTIFFENGIGIALVNLAAGQVLALLIRLYYRLRYGNRRHKNYRS